MSNRPVQSILVHFGQLFFLCKFLGVYPHDWEYFKRDHVLRRSNTGPWLVLASLASMITLYNLLIFSFSDEDRTLKASQSTLTFVIGLFLTYIGLVMMTTDQLTAIRNQSKLGDIYERIRGVDERLQKENIIIDNSSLTIRIRVLILLAAICELSITISTYWLLVDHTEWMSLMWLCSSLPTFFNSLDKIWFAATIFSLKQRFRAINQALEEMVRVHDKYKTVIFDRSMPIDVDGSVVPFFSRIQYQNNLDYLYKELNSGKNLLSLKNYLSGNKIVPVSIRSFTGESIPTSDDKQRKQIHSQYHKPMPDSDLLHMQKIEDKLNNFCQMHDEICEIGKTLNELWSYPILVLMAHGFLIFTAQLYFLYCATQGQAIPSIFRSAKNAIISAIYLIYVAGKCAYLIYLSWQTSTESKRTGVCLHKCSVVADENFLYEIVNHLSLKLLNHSVDFSACGFFTLDMETLYSVSGGITSYLIILIQFNLAAQQAKDAVRTFSNFNDTSSSPSSMPPTFTDELNGTTAISSVINYLASTVMTPSSQE